VGGNAVVSPLNDAVQRQALPDVAAPDVIRGSRGDRQTALGATALVLAPHQIRVNAVAPAVVATAIYERFVPADKLEATA
jgi:hypothetical protein